MIKFSMERSIKIILIGDYAVGKTSVRRNYMGETFQTNYLPTIGCDFSFKRINYKEQGNLIKILIWDLAGDASFKRVHSQFYKGAHGAIIMYDITSRNSFEHVKDWVRNFYKEIKPYKPPIVIVGNKIDLIPAKSDQQSINSGFVSLADEEKLAKEIREEYNNEIIVLTSRTSAKTGVNIDNMFHELIESIMDWLQKTKFDYIKTLLHSKSMEQLVPFANIFLFHETMGPINLLHSPPKSREFKIKYSDFINEGIKLFAFYDFETLSKRRVMHGIHKWSNPEGNYLYVIFCLDNEQAKANEELHIIGVHISPLLSEVIKSIEPIIYGYLFHFMNRYIYLLQSAEFRGAHLRKVTLPSKLKEKLYRELEDLRTQIYTQALTLF